MATQPTTRKRLRQLSLLLLLPAIIVPLWVPFYNSADPAYSFNGIPFFYWYQFLWIIISSVVTGLVYFLNRDPSAPTNS